MASNQSSLDQDVERAAAALRKAEAFFITAGAGMGVDSGLPDFRGTQGFWKAYPAIAKLGLDFAQMANPDWFQKSPELAWAFYGHRLNLYRSTLPHAGFLQLLKVAERKPHGYFVFTSNVDGQFQKAGFEPAQIVECHGSIHHFQCTKPCGDHIWDAAHEVVAVNEEQFKAVPPLPACPHCGALARPNVLMFGDHSWNPGRTWKQESRLKTWLTRLGKNKAKVAVVEIGAGTAIPTVRHRSEDVAADFAAVLIRINPRAPQVPAGGLPLPLNAAEGIRRICT
ncbi:MAG TPA: Sir2 family NAD-dependent protein deacetylase [Candidatus Acidoferrum sp.]|nr:Sir2 family NAD-dependent protein deacetylase [Candidatus Acidoferrum sp.]